MTKMRFVLGALALGLAFAALTEAEAGRLDIYPNGVAPPAVQPRLFRKQIVRQAPRVKRPRPRAVQIPAVKIDSPTYYDFQPEQLTPVDFGQLKAASQPRAVGQTQP